MLGQRGTPAATILRVFVFAGFAAGGMLIASFFYCDGRVDRSAYRDRLGHVGDLKTEGDADRLLLPYCRKEVVHPGEIKYYGLPRGSGLCLCAPVTVEVVVLHTDGGGVVISTVVEQSVGLSRRWGSWHAGPARLFPAARPGPVRGGATPSPG